jgi:hypothetical protein
MEKKESKTKERLVLPCPEVEALRKVEADSGAIREEGEVMAVVWEEILLLMVRERKTLLLVYDKEALV